MRSISLLFIAALAFAGGCQDAGNSRDETTERSQNQSGTEAISEERTSGGATESQGSSDDSQGNEQAEASEASTSTSTSTVPPTRADLDGYMARFDQSLPWTYGERVPGELAGVWVSDDPEGDPIEFEVDGVPGTFSEDFVGHRTVGLYAIASDGKIVTVSRYGEASLGSHFQFHGDTITGPQGPNPNVTWHRQQ